MNLEKIAQAEADYAAATTADGRCRALLNACRQTVNNDPLRTRRYLRGLRPLLGEVQDPTLRYYALGLFIAIWTFQGRFQRVLAYREAYLRYWQNPELMGGYWYYSNFAYVFINMATCLPSLETARIGLAYAQKGLQLIESGAHYSFKGRQTRLNLIGCGLFLIGETAQAIAYWRAAALVWESLPNADSELFTLYEHLAEAYAQLGRWRTAYHYARRLRNPEAKVVQRAMGLYWMGVARWRRGEPARAVRLWRRALREARGFCYMPLHTRVWALLAEAFAQMERPAWALRCWRRAWYWAAVERREHPYGIRFLAALEQAHPIGAHDLPLPRLLLADCAPSKRALPWVRDVEDLLHANFSDVHFGVETLAQVLQINVRTLHRKIQKTFQKTPHELLLQVRLHAARFWLVQSPTWTLSQVAQRAGFRSLAYFNQVFKKYHQQLPSQYRDAQSR